MTLELAALIHAQHENELDDLPYWLGLQAEHPGRLLELGCGSGRVLLPLARAGGAVIGVDRDPAALEILRQTAGGQLPPVIRADFTALPLAGKLAAALMPCNTYSTLTAGERARLLAGLHSRLAPGGVFAASLPNPAALLALDDSEDEVEDSFTHPHSGNPVQVSSGWQRQGDELRVRWQYDHLLPDGQVQRHSAEVCHHLTPTAALLAELAAAGFHPAAYGGYARQPFTARSPILILEARRDT